MLGTDRFHGYESQTSVQESNPLVDEILRDVVEYTQHKESDYGGNLLLYDPTNKRVFL